MSDMITGDQSDGGRCIDRRYFISGTAAVALTTAIAATLGGCTSNSNESATSGSTSESSEPSWFTAPDPVEESKISQTVESDVVVIGAGMSGNAAACSCAERGLSVSVVERMETWSGRGYGVGVIDSKIMEAAGLDIDRSLAQKYWTRCCGSRINEKLLSLYMNRSREAADWGFEKCAAAGVSVLLWDGYSRDPQFPDSAGYHVFFGGPEQSAGKDWSRDLTLCLNDDAIKAGATYYYNNHAEYLEKDDDTVTGCVATDADGNYVRYHAKKGVVLATGDVVGNQEMLEYYAPEIAQCNYKLYTPVGGNTGDGHAMGLWAGGAMQEGDFPPMLHPQVGAYYQCGFLCVNQDGERFFNEATWVNGKSLNYLRQPGQCGYVVFDKNWAQNNLETLPYGGGMFWDTFRVLGSGSWDAVAGQQTVDDAVEKGSFVFKADSIEELASKVDIDATALKETIARYNQLCEADNDEDFGKDPLFLTPVEEAPFYISKAIPGILATVGGLKVDTRLNVTDADGNAIAGLYAVGNVSGDFYAVDYPINIPGNSQGRCLTWGYLVGEFIEKE